MAEEVHILLRCHEHSGCSLLLGAGFEIDKAFDFGLLAVGAWDMAVAADLFPVVSVVTIRESGTLPRVEVTFLVRHGSH